MRSTWPRTWSSCRGIRATTRWPATAAASKAAIACSRCFRSPKLLDELLSALSQTQYLEPTEIEAEQVKRLRAQGVAYLLKGDLELGKTQIAALAEMLAKQKADQQAAGAAAEAKAREEKKPDDQIAKAKTDAMAGHNGRVETLESALNEVQGYWALAGSDSAAAVQHFEKAKDMGKKSSVAGLSAGRRQGQGRTTGERGGRPGRRPRLSAGQLCRNLAPGRQDGRGDRGFQKVASHLRLDRPGGADLPATDGALP